MNRQIISMVHKKCRNSVYPSSNISRFTVPDDKVLWEVHFAEYSPVEYSSKGLKGKPWSDPSLEDNSFKPKWNQIDGNKDKFLPVICNHFTISYFININYR